MKAKAIDKSQLKNSSLGEYFLWDGCRITNYTYSKVKRTS